VVEKLARDGVKEGVVVCAESQTRGRGRLGRKWISPARKGLWFSILLRPDLSPQMTTRLTVASATALRRAIKLQTGCSPEIKWPNDILMGGKKVAGILTEMSAELDRVRYVILGIGVDVNLTANDFPPDLRKIATSLRIETGKPASRAELAVNIFRELDRDYANSPAWRMNGSRIAPPSAARSPCNSARGRSAVAWNRSTTTARCCCAPSTAIWSASSAGTSPWRNNSYIIHDPPF